MPTVSHARGVRKERIAMLHRGLRSTELLAIAVSIAALAAMPAAAQTAPAPAQTKEAGKAWATPRTPDGHPDLQGVWDFATLTPLERPRSLADKAVLTDQEAAAYERRLKALNDKDRRDAPPGAVTDVGRAYNEFWWDRGNGLNDRRTSLVSDPPDGKIPPLTPEAKKRAAARASAIGRLADASGGPPDPETAVDGTQGGVDGRGGRGDNPEDRGLSERCILGFNSGPPMIPSAYNNNFQIVQSPGHVVIVSEMVHSARVVPMDGRPHAPSNIRLLVGDSRGRWDGETLVVETTNFTDKTSFRGTTKNMRLIERFTRVGPDRLNYEFTVDDPASYARSWTAMVPTKRNPERIYEYACQEGNYGLEGQLSSSRAEDRARDAARKQTSF